MVVGVTQAVSRWDSATGQLLAYQLRQWKLTKGQVKHGSGLNNARRATERWLAPIKPHLQHLAAASAAGTSLVANLQHITVTLATWDAVWEVYLDPKWARQRLRLYGAQDRALEQFFKNLEEDMAEVSMKRHGHAKQLVVFLGPTQQPGSHTSSILRASSPLPAKRSKRTEAEQPAEPTQPTKVKGTGKGKAANAKPAPQPGRWLDRDCNAALHMQRIWESRWRPLELCWWPEQGKLPAKGKEYPGLGYKRLRDKPPKAQQQPAAAQ
ncbi:uncharacterized protein HaLaN_19215 [Haematococcus lacustris]|uniref:Uncharacterized protein n=1 Tax=Haematococcus lacustris TaxID=44745 RepID=A0A699ZHW7_HAELA|nr:uncharacterized protein HaLaN_19215 [Haematococcus lacustris]